MSATAINSLRYCWSDSDIKFLDIDALDLAPGKSMFLYGFSGSRKLKLIAAIAGVADVACDINRVAGKDMGALSGGQRDRFCAENLGIIFQVFNLIPWLCPVKNVPLPCRLSDARRTNTDVDLVATADRLLAGLGMRDAARPHKRASARSVGQQQRVATAPAMIESPEAVLADEPAFALDEKAKEGFPRLFLRECAQAGIRLLCVSRDRRFADHYDRSADFRDLNGKDT